MVERAVESLGARAHCLFFTGEAARGETTVQKKIRQVPNLGYSNEQKFQGLDLLRHARGAFGAVPDVWHIHNHNLGKNPALTQEVTNLAMAGQKILLQIHDFAEDGRPDNYSSLGKLKKRLYPIAPHIHYAALNQRDIGFLQSIGIPAEQLHLLPNAVSPLPSTKLETRTPELETPLFVYPCRAIRRKNIGEILLWSAVMPKAKFAITLAPKNPDVKPIYDAWVSFAEELGLHIEFDAGSTCELHEMVAKADALITTSIAESSGQAFLEPWLAGKPLVGRNLPEMTRDFEQHGLDLSQLYNRLGVPLTSTDWNIGPEFFHAVETHQRVACEAYGRDGSDERLENAKTELVQRGTVDFGILNEKMQRVIIRAAKENPGLFGEGLGDASEQVAGNRDVVQTAYSPEAYGDHLASIYQTVLAAQPGSVQYADGEKLLDTFLMPGRVNLLRS